MCDEALESWRDGVMDKTNNKSRCSSTPVLQHSRPSVLGVIPARWGSTRFPGKSLAMIAGKPLIQRVVERVKLAKRLSGVLVATDDARIRDAVAGLGVTVAMTRPDHPSGTDRIAEAVRGRAADIVTNIQGDEPLIDPALIDRLAAVLADDVAGTWDMATAAAAIVSDEDVRNPSVVKVVRDTAGKALYFSRSPIPFVREKDSGAGGGESLYWRHIGIYAYRRTYLEKLVKTPPCALENAEKLEQLRALFIGCRMKVIETAEAAVGVDTPEDVARVEKALESGA